MAILVGMDEAGYGPNLGPLVVAATVWNLEERAAGDAPSVSLATNDTLSTSPASSAADRPARKPGHRSKPFDPPDLYALLADAVSPSPQDGRVAIADSKALFQQGAGLAHLERGVHAGLMALRRPARTWRRLVAELAADPEDHCGVLPWHDGFDCPLPVDASADDVTALGELLAGCFNSNGESGGVVDKASNTRIELLDIRARLVQPAEFNGLCDSLGNKAAALSHVTLALLAEIVEGLRDEKRVRAERIGKSPVAPAPGPLHVVCDKHGGRNRYAPLLMHFFPDQWVETQAESRAESCYTWGQADARVDVCFRRGGESFLPAALASMTAKYVREIAMRALNSYWCARVKDLRPTAGYPSDARRYRAAIAAAQRAAGIEDRVLWRNR